MLKRNGDLLRNAVPGFDAKLTDTELASYNAAFSIIQRDYSQIEDVRRQLDRLNNGTWEQSDAKLFDTIHAPDGTEWKAHVSLLQLSKSEMLLCRSERDGKWAIVQRLNTNGSYAGKNGNVAVLLAGNNAHDLVNDYIAQAEHTLRFMARNLTAKAQQVVCEKYPDQNPGRVIRAISQRCALAVDNPEALQQRQEQTIDRTVKRSRGMSI